MNEERGSGTPFGDSFDPELMFCPDSLDDESVELEDDTKKKIVFDSDDDQTDVGGRNRLGCVRNERHGELDSSSLNIRKPRRCAGYLWRNSQKVCRQSACPPNTGACNMQFNRNDNEVALAENRSMIGFGRQELNQENNKQKQGEGLTNHMEELGMKNVVKERDESDGCRLSSTISETINRGEDIPLVTLAHESGRLSYVDSQEPEDIPLSEPLSFVDRYLSLNNFKLCDSDRDAATKSNQIIYPPMLNAKGFQCLARRAYIKRAEESGAFDWDEQPQKKEEFFSLKERCQLSHKCYISDTTTTMQDADGSKCPKFLDVSSDEDISGHVESMARQGLKGDSGTNNCANELVGDVNILSPAINLDKNEVEIDEEHFLTGVGFDTQQAAEAMEALVQFPPNSNACYTHKIPSGIIDQSSDVAAIFKKSGKDTSTATGQHIKSKRSAKKLYENVAFLSGELDPYLRGHSCSSEPKKKLKEDGSSVCLNLDDEKTQVRRISCENKTQQRKRSSENIQGRTSPQSLRLNYLDGLFERNTQSSVVIPKRRRSQRLRYPPRHLLYPAEQSKGTSDDCVEFNFSKKRSKTNDLITDVQEKCKRKENYSNLASGASLGDDDSSRVIKFKCWSYPKKKRTSSNFLRHSGEPKHQDSMNIFMERPTFFPIEHQSSKRLAGNLVVYTRRMKSESVSKGSSAIGKCDTSGKSLYSHTSESPKESGCNGPANHGKEDCIEQTLTFDNVINTVHNSERVKFDQGWKIDSCALNFFKKCDDRTIKLKEKSISPVIRELRRLGSNERQLHFKPRDSRRWVSAATVNVLFSQNLSNKTIRQLKKIAVRLGFSEASCCSAATHFIADKFVRTQNMLEAIAFGKLVVTPSWLESCGQAGYLIAEKSYILRDARKEKEIGFSMPASLGRASQRPLLLGQRVLVTPNVKPNKDLIQTLVKAVHGQEVEDFQLAKTKYGALSPDLLILSCEEDYGYCEPFLERGVAIYSSELLLNGIVIQKLQYERHRILMNYHATTRSGKEKKVGLVEQCSYDILFQQQRTKIVAK